MYSADIVSSNDIALEGVRGVRGVCVRSTNA